jgi:hypothetical protein
MTALPTGSSNWHKWEVSGVKPEGGRIVTIVTYYHGQTMELLHQSCSVSFPANMSDLDLTNGVNRVNRAVVMCRS